MRWVRAGFIPDWSEPEGQLGDLIWLKKKEKRDEVRGYSEEDSPGH